ncbi:hypothetical protein L3X38_026950 [Prunus dulcis]|uniref:Uncharacterized protein n=1 Tax=Prunus dulcis TaxID=3755 RepID=A0AAD4VM09_PRUDU|nr:hypothetical protein L3X38_026950 [Prunus dulcis]
MAGSQPANDQNVVMAQNSERGPSQNVEPMHGDHVIPKTSLNHRVLVADILSRNDEEDEEDDMNSESDDIAEGRSFSSGKFFPTRPSRARNTVLPV